MTPLQVGGLTPLSTQDYPGELSAVVFCQGCPWRCRYCHNPELLPRNADNELSWPEILAFLERRQGLLDAVVFSGGEPTLQRGLGGAMVQVRQLGFKVGLHTAGCYPQRLAELIPLADWVGLDIKALPNDYARITGSTNSGDQAWQSLDKVIASGVDYEVRVTVHSALTTSHTLDVLMKRLASNGVRSLALQTCRSIACLDPNLEPSRDRDVHGMLSKLVTPEGLNPVFR